MSLADSVRQTIRRYDLVPERGRVVVALSGGGDSVALLHLLRDLAVDGDLVVAGAAHFNHRLRPNAGQDEQFCRDLCAALSVPLELGRADVRSVAQATKRSIEDTARQLRYAFLHEAAGRLTADVIAVGHSRDDQAETFLLRIIRGAGTRGLAAIRPKAGMVIRPLIGTSRPELRRFAEERGLAYREDETNADLSVPRNRVRHELLPYLARVFSPNIVEVLAREAELAREDDDRLEREAIEIAGSVVLTDTRQATTEAPPGSSAARTASPSEPSRAREVVELDAERLVALHPAIASRVARIALARLRGGRFIGFDQVQRFLDFAHAGRSGRLLSLPGQQVRLRHGESGRLVIELAAAPPRGGPARHGGQPAPMSTEAGRAAVGPVAPGLEGRERGNSFSFSLSIPGEVILPEQRWAVSAEWASASEASGSNGLVALVEGLNGPLTVRSRKPGDRFRPPGLGGRAKKLQDYFVDRKVPRADRDRVPLVVDRDDRIVWIVGHAVAEGFRAATPSQGVILLKARQLGGEV